MSQITIRGLEADLENKIRTEAKRSGKSLNRVILDLLENTSGHNNRSVHKPKADSLRNLAGGWSRDEATEFIASVKLCEQIDEEMWNG